MTISLLNFIPQEKESSFFFSRLREIAEFAKNGNYGCASIFGKFAVHLTPRLLNEGASEFQNLLREIILDKKIWENYVFDMLDEKNDSDPSSKATFAETYFRVFCCIILRKDIFPDSFSLNSVSEIIKLCLRTLKLADPKEYHSKDSPTQLALLRGNLSMSFAQFANLEINDNIQYHDLTESVKYLLNILRKEEGNTRQNASFALVQLAKTEQYRDEIRRQKGFESLHQIMMPK